MTSTRAPFAIPVALAFCAAASACAPTTTSTTPSSAAPNTAARAPRPERRGEDAAPADDTPTRAHPVLTAAGRLFVLLGKATETAVPSEHLLVAGGWRVELADQGAVAERAFTLVGPTGQCVGKSVRAFSLTLDYGGYSAPSLPGRAQRAVEVTGCGALAASDDFAVALEGRDSAARWVHPAHLDDAAMPADRRLGENEVWVHRFGLPESDVQIVERTVLRYVTPSCSEELNETIVVDESDRPLSHHQDFSLRGAIERTGTPLVVLVGHDEPHLRVVAADAEARVALDTELDGFEDAHQPGC